MLMKYVQTVDSSGYNQRQNKPNKRENYDMKYIYNYDKWIRTRRSDR